nr:nuclear receptor coactivator 5-like [Caretta caretta]
MTVTETTLTEPPTLSAEERLKRKELRREELYRQYFEEIKRRFDSERLVDCSVIVVNKQTKEYAESVGRKVRDLGMVVDLIFLNTEMSLTQALEDVGRGGSPFAIVITQQHQVHRSCTVNIMFGTPQEHRNMPQADAMVLVVRNYERYKTETQIGSNAIIVKDVRVQRGDIHGGKYGVLSEIVNFMEFLEEAGCVLEEAGPLCVYSILKLHISIESEALKVLNKP